MKQGVLVAALAIQIVACASLMAGEPARIARDNPTIYGGGNPAKAVGDTIDLMGPTGSGAPYLGDFEAGWNGWTSVDVTSPTETHWQVSDYNQAVPGNLAAWCGDITFATCNDSLDIVGGYGNSWHDLLAFRTSVADPGSPADVVVTATLQHDTEPAYDFVYLSAEVENSQEYSDLAQWDGQGIVSVNTGTTILPVEYVDGTDVKLLFRFTSDGGWSDADCLFYTAGACQVDDITVTVSQTGQMDIVSFTDFQDGTTGDWSTELPTGVGDFAALWPYLEDIDPCHTNYSNQVAFIDDGTVVPGTGGSHCINWCYGPMGYIVTTTGGLVGPSGHIQNNILSPVMPWPNVAHDGVTVAWDVYLHEDLSADAPGIFYLWGVRSADTDNSAGNGAQVLTEQTFRSDNFFFNGGPMYRRDFREVTDLVNPGRDEIQVMLGIYEIGWAWGWTGNDGYPAPYFDNVAVKTYPISGPTMTGRQMDLAQDNFPEIDMIDAVNPGDMHVRFDMAQDIAPYSYAGNPQNDPGDSVVVKIVPVRSGATIIGAPEMHYIIDPNPTFDVWRTTATTGVVTGVPAMRNYTPYLNTWAFDLPDTGTLFPGDILHYYFRAGDDVSGDIRYATLPRDISGYGDFDDPQAYDHNFVVRALPTLTDDGQGGFQAPEVLFWDDSVDAGDEEWYAAFANMGFAIGDDYDVYTTNQPTSGVGNGIGGRTNGPALALYEVLVYSSGDQSSYTLGVGDTSYDKSDDVGALQNWLSAGGKGLFLTGDGLAGNVSSSHGTSNGYEFVRDIMGVEPVATDLRPFIGNQTTPLVLPIGGNPVFSYTDPWIAYGGCDRINQFDALELRPGATRLAEFGDPSNFPGAYPYSAATLNVLANSSHIVSLPYDLAVIYTDPHAKTGAPLAARSKVLRDVIQYFGYGIIYYPTDVPGDGARFAVTNAPNPFNPRTSIAYTIDKPGHLTLKIFNVRGQVVRTLLDQRVEVGGHVVWDGTDDSGQQLASGVYFREARLGTRVEVGKMLLVK